jgi:hypothetical protein
MWLEWAATCARRSSESAEHASARGRDKPDRRGPRAVQTAAHTSDRFSGQCVIHLGKKGVSFGGLGCGLKAEMAYGADQAQACSSLLFFIFSYSPFYFNFQFQISKPNFKSCFEFQISNIK